MKKDENGSNLFKGTGILKSYKHDREFTFLFKYELNHLTRLGVGSDNYIFEIWESGRELQSKFSFQLRVMENGKDLKVVDLFGDSSNYYLGKGISIAIILKAKNLFNKRIISEASGGWEDAQQKVWERMRVRGLVEYDSTNNYYFTV